MNIICIEQITH